MNDSNKERWNTLIQNALLYYKGTLIIQDDEEEDWNTTIPPLPEGITKLIIQERINSNIMTIEGLPETLTVLTIKGVDSVNFPVLPSSLLELYLDNIPYLGELPPLPSSLTILYMEECELKKLPSLPNSLQVLNCGLNNLESLPSLPNSLIQLDCYINKLTSLPPLPSSLERLDCHFNQLTSLPPLPDSLKKLDVMQNKITALPFELPSQLIVLNVGQNLLTTLPPLPPRLTFFRSDYPSGVGNPYKEPYRGWVEEFNKNKMDIRGLRKRIATLYGPQARNITHLQEFIDSSTRLPSNMGSQIGPAAIIGSFLSGRKKGTIHQQANYWKKLLKPRGGTRKRSSIKKRKTRKV